MQLGSRRGPPCEWRDRARANEMQIPGRAASSVPARCHDDRGSPHQRAEPAPELTRFRAPSYRHPAILFPCFRQVAYLQWIDNAFLQERGRSRYSREIELPAHRGRIGIAPASARDLDAVSRSGRFPPDGLGTRKVASLARTSKPPRAARENWTKPTSSSFSPSGSARSRRGVAALKIRVARPERIPALLSGREMGSHIWASRALATSGKASSSRSRMAAASPQSPRALNRGGVVEDVESNGAPQAGRDIALSSSRLQYLAFRS